MKSLFEYILEKQSINFGKSNPNYGQCIILAGGPGSGKGYVKDHKILADFKSVDVDELKKMYIKMVEKGKIKDDKSYNLKNPEDVSELHMKVKERGWKNKQREHFWKQHASDKSNLPNILWDMVSDDVKDIDEIIKYAKPIGYNITLVWVCCNIDTAREANQYRDRTVSDNVITKGHKGAYKTLIALLQNKYPETNEGLDNVWIAFTAGYKRMLVDEYKKNPVIKVKKDENNNFIFDSNDKELIDNFLEDQMPLNPNFDKEEEDERERKKKLLPSKLKESLDEIEYNDCLDCLEYMIQNEILN
ncbi:hypothetical protein IKN40_06735 [bacterium]|nr:hypothetical protein [bacterium]